MAVIADVFEGLIIDNQTGEVIGKTTLQDSNIESTVQSNDVNGGRGNSLLGVLHSNRDIVISWNDVSFDFGWVAKQFGQDVVTGAGKAYAFPKHYMTRDNEGVAEIEVANTPSTVNEMKIYNEAGERITGFTVEGKKVDFTNATPVVPIGEKVEVRTYVYDTPATTQTFQIDNKVFPKGMKIVLETLEIDPQTERELAMIQYEFYNCLPDGNVTINTAAERTAQPIGSSFRVVKPANSTVVGKVSRIPIAA
jgi:hypothetical protein